MTEGGRTRDPIRNRDGDVVYTSFQERPQPAFALDPLHKGLLGISAVLALGLFVYFFFRSLSMDENLPMHYDFSGDVTRVGSSWESVGTLAMLAVTTVGVVILARYPRIYNFPFMLTEHNVQRQYKNAVQMMAWLAFSCALIMLVMVGSWLGVFSVHWTWVAVALMMLSLGYFMWRMFKFR
ncbi:MAG: hypothetical protein HLX51_04395 [Micrococcaceae bacterium]|nr:hypothetical protein [Micrococcaceae bacterium]